MAFKSKTVIDEDTGKKIVAYGIADKFGIATLSERLFCKSILACIADGLIKKPESARLRYEVAGLAVRSIDKQQILTNSAGDTGKLRVSFGSGDHLSPLQEQNDSSLRVRKMTQQIDIAQRLFADEYGMGRKMYGYMLTPTVPNASKGALARDFKVYRDRVAALFKALKDGTSRNNGLQLVDKSGNPVDYIGGMVGFELTVNRDVMKAGGVHGLYNHHGHLILLTAAPLDVDACRDMFFDKWQRLNAKDYQLSKNAFQFDKIVAKNPSTIKNAYLYDALKETVKYATKPDTWSYFDDIANSRYQREIFAEIYNSLRGVKRKRAYGVLLNAKTFLNVFSKFENAISMSTASSMPEIVTQLVELSNSGGRYSSKHLRALTPNEVLFYNKDLVSGILVAPGLESEMNDYIDNELSLSDELSKRFISVFKDMVFTNSIEDLLSKLAYQIQDAEKVKNYNKAKDLMILGDAIFDNITSMTPVHSEKPVFGLTVSEWESGKSAYWFYPDSDVVTYKVRQNSYLDIDTKCHTDYQKEMAKKFGDLYFAKYGHLVKANDESDFYVDQYFKLGSKFGIDSSRMKRKEKVNLFVSLGCSVEEFFEDEF